MADDRPDSPPAGSNGRGHASDLDRLPPPAFPPGVRSTHRRNVRAPDSGAGSSPGLTDDGVPEEAFISPDEPIVRSGTRMAADAFISPDEPIARRSPLESMELDEEPIDGDGLVTGIGDDPHLFADLAPDLAMVRFDDPAVTDLVLKVGRLADALREKGEAALRTTPDMNRFEATLRAYCVGYLAAQRDASD